MSIAIIIPTHNDEQVIESVVNDILSNRNSQGIAKIILVENGSRDQTAEVCRRLAVSVPGAAVIALSIPQAGIGYAYHAGMKYVQDHLSSEIDWVLLSASDLPFGYSDLNSFRKLSISSHEKTVAIGSKAHAKSVVSRGLKRSLVSFVFRCLRRLFLGIRVGDTQGTFLVPSEALNECLKTKSRDFFFTTEMTFNLVRKDFTIIEIPIELRPEIRMSTVRPLRHGYALLKQMILLRCR